MPSVPHLDNLVIFVDPALDFNPFLNRGEIEEIFTWERDDFTISDSKPGTSGEQEGSAQYHSEV